MKEIETNYEYQLFVSFLKKENSPKAKVLLEKLYGMETNDDYNLFKLNILFEGLLNAS